jgi:hypothetical protein
MALPRDERMSPHDLLKYVKDQYDRLAEISPLVPAVIIAKFQSKFKKYTDISKPEEANGLEKITVYKPSAQDDADATPGTVRVKIGPVPSSSFSVVNPMKSVKETFVSSVESVQLPAIPTATIREAEAASPPVPSS